MIGSPLDPSQKFKIAKAAVATASQDLTFFTRFLKTRDEATGGIRKWPRYEYLDVVFRELPQHKQLWIPKSRRTMMTWSMCAYLLWRALFDEVFYGVIQSRVEDDSAEYLRDKVKFLYNSLPRWFKAVLFDVQEPEFTRLEHRFPNENRIKGVAQGPDVARGDTPSVVVVDEAAFQPEFGAAMTALTPLGEKNAQLIYVSSVAPGVFNDVVTGKPDGPVVKLLEGNAELPDEYRQGISMWNLEAGGTVVRVHFSADPEKGTQWLEEAEKRFVGGLQGPIFRREMMIEADAFAGQRVYPHFTGEFPQIQDFEVPKGVTRWISGDYGYRNPTAMLAICFLGETEYGPRYGVYDEIYESGLSIDQLKKLLHVKFGPSDLFEREWVDPTTDSVREGDTKTHFWLFNNGPYARFFHKANNSEDGIILVGEWLHQGRLIIHPRCHNLVWEMKNYRWQDWTEKVAQQRDPKEKPRKKKDHAADAIKYFANAVRLDEVPDFEVNERRPFIESILEEMTREDLPDYMGRYVASF